MECYIWLQVIPWVVQYPSLYPVPRLSILPRPGGSREDACRGTGYREGYWTTHGMIFLSHTMHLEKGREGYGHAQIWLADQRGKDTEILQSDWSIEEGRILEGRILKSCNLIGPFTGKDTGPRGKDTGLPAYSNGDPISFPLQACGIQLVFREAQQYLPSN